MEYKFKVGDRVIGNKLANSYGITKQGWTGTVTATHPHGFIADGCYFLDYSAFDLISSPSNNKIVITTYGSTTLARLYDGNKVIKSAEAKCSPDDTYDFATGANLAYDRLMRPTAKTEDKPEPVKLYCVKDYDPGRCLTKGKVYEIAADKRFTYDNGVRTADCATGKFESAQHLMKTWLGKHLVPLVKRPAKTKECVLITGDRSCYAKDGDVVYLDGKNNYADADGFIWGIGAGYDCGDYLVLDGYQPEEPAKEEPKYYSGKVVCVVSGKEGLTKGKVYEVKNGYLIDDDKHQRPHMFDAQKSIDDDFLCDWFIEYKGEQA